MDSQSGPSGMKRKVCKIMTDEQLLSVLNDSDDECSLYSVSDDKIDSSSDASEAPVSAEISLEPSFLNTDDPEPADNDWHEVDISKLPLHIQFTDQEEYKYSNDYPQNPLNLTAVEVYKRFFDKEILDITVLETNRNAANFIRQSKKRTYRLNQWSDTNSNEVWNFFAIVLYMGIVKYPKISNYWEKNILYNNSLVPSVMSRNRFQLLLRFVHFADNDLAEDDRLYKIKNLMNMMQERFDNEYVPGKFIAVDESMIPFQGRLFFKQYLPNKTHKYGVKVFKLCNPIGYTLQMSVYAGKTAESSGSGLAERIVLQLAEKYLNKGRVLITDNYYTCVPLALSLLQKNTHLLGTLRKNRKGLPKDVINKKIAKGEVIGKQNSKGVVVGKWKDKREVYFLSTKHDLEKVETGKASRSGERVRKPAAILEYNTGKQGIDLSDQMASYFTPLRRTIRWYHKVAFEVLLNTAVVNSWIIYNKFSNKKTQITEFREQLVLQMLKIDKHGEKTVNPEMPNLVPTNTTQNTVQQHLLQETEERDNRYRRVRRRCTVCYMEAAKLQGREYAQKNAKMVKMLCSACQKFMCISCFSKHIQMMNKKK